jgi:hypothetical protein
MDHYSDRCVKEDHREIREKIDEFLRLADRKRILFWITF